MKLTQCNTYYSDVASRAAGNHFGKDYERTVNYYATSAIITRAMHTNWDVNDPKTIEREHLFMPKIRPVTSCNR